MKLKANRLINMSGSLGRRFACASAILGLYFAVTESFIYSQVDGRLPDGACTAMAGACAAMAPGFGGGGGVAGPSSVVGQVVGAARAAGSARAAAGGQQRRALSSMLRCQALSAAARV